jgi:hypothetical protein
MCIRDRIRLVRAENVTRAAGQTAFVDRDYDANGNLRYEARDGVRTDFVPFSPPTGDVYQIIRPRGLTSTFTDYYRGIPRLETHEEGVQVQRTVSAAGNVETERDGELRQSSYAYDGLNRLIRITPPPNNPGNPLAATTIDYTSSTKTATRGASLPLVQVTSYDGFGRVRSINHGGISTVYNHDALGRLVFVSNPGDAVNGTTYEYDLLDRLRFVRHPGGRFIERAYSGSLTSVTDERGYTTTYAYRAYGDPDQAFLMQITAPAGAAEAGVAIERNNARDMVTKVTQGGFSRTFGYDARNYLVCSSHPEILPQGTAVPDCAANPTTNVVRYGRDGAGNMTSRTVGSSPTTEFDFDRRNRLARIRYPTAATPNVLYTYFRTDKLRTVESPIAVRTLGYDFGDNLVSETLAAGSVSMATTYRYNDKEQIREIVYPVSNQTVTYSLDALGRPTAISGYLTEVQYWPSGQVRQITYANGVTTRYEQDGRLRPSTMTVRRGSATPEVDQVWGYDDANNLNSVTDSADTSFNRVLVHDPINRLTTVNAPGAWGNGSISYDGAGNLRTKTLGGYSFTLGYGSTNNRMLSSSGARSATYGYDAYGNVAARNAETFAYDDASNLRCYNCAFGNRIEYSYDGQNRRVFVDRAGVRTFEFWTQGGQLLADYSPTQYNRLTHYIYLSDKRVAQRSTDSRSPTSTAMTASSNPVETGQSVTLSATVSGGSPSGTVNFRSSGVVIGSANLAGSTASFSTSFSVAGTRQIVADYAGNSTSAPSTSSPLSLTVNQAPANTATAVTASSTAPLTRHCVVVTATVSGVSPTGTASTTFPGSKLTTPTTVPLINGIGTFAARKFPAGSNLITVNYSGDTLNRPSSGQLALNVTADPNWVGIDPPCGTWRVLAPTSVSASRSGSGPISTVASVSTTGGVTPITYSWSRVNGSTAIAVSGTQSATFSADITAGTTLTGTFRVTVQDATGDLGTSDVTVTFSAAAPMAASITPSPLYAYRTGPGYVTASATASASGGTGPYTFTWAKLTGSNFTISGANSQTLTLTGYAFAMWCELPEPAEGTFRVTARDSLGQTTTRDLLVRFSASPAGPIPSMCW